MDEAAGVRRPPWGDIHDLPRTDPDNFGYERDVAEDAR
jgi:hypothetical protein